MGIEVGAGASGRTYNTPEHCVRPKTTNKRTQFGTKTSQHLRIPKEKRAINHRTVYYMGKGTTPHGHNTFDAIAENEAGARKNAQHTQRGSRTDRG